MKCSNERPCAQCVSQNVTCEDKVRYKACTGATDIAVCDSAADLATDTVCKDHRKGEDLEKYEDVTEAICTTVNDSVMELVTDMACEDVEKCEKCTEAVDTTINDSVASLSDPSGPPSDMESMLVALLYNCSLSTSP